MKSKIYTRILTAFLIISYYLTNAQTAQLATWDFAGGNTSPVLTAGISSASINVGGSLQSVVSSNSFLVTNIWATSPALALNGSGTMAAQYISFTISPTSNYAMNISNVAIQGYIQNDHSRNFLLAYISPTTGNVVTVTGSSVTSVTHNVTFPVSLTNITTPLEFRFYMYNYPVYPYETAGFGEQAGSDLVISGNVTNSATQVIPGTWSLQGNAIAPSQFFGSTNNQDLPFYTNNTEKLRISSNGNIGIGTASPGQKLSVAGNIGIEGNGSGLQFNDGTFLTSAVKVNNSVQNGQTADANVSGVTLSNGNVSVTGDYFQNGKKLDFSSVSAWTFGGFQDLNPNSPTYNQWLGQISNTPWQQKMGLNAAVLELNANVSAWQGISVGGRNQYSPGGPDVINGLPAYGIAMTTGTGIVQIAGYNGINFTDNTFANAPAISIKNGNVGVGTSTQPTQKLEVNGNIKIDGATNGIIFPDGSKISTATVVGGGWGMSGAYNTYAGNANIQGSLKIGTGSMVLNGKTTSPVTGIAGINEIFSDAVADPLYLNKSVNANILLNANGGNVGIGLGSTTTPSEKLEVAGNIKTNGIVLPDGIITSAASLNLWKQDTYSIPYSVGIFTYNPANPATEANNANYLGFVCNTSYGNPSYCNSCRTSPSTSNCPPFDFITPISTQAITPTTSTMPVILGPNYHPTGSDYLFTLGVSGNADFQGGLMAHDATIGTFNGPMLMKGQIQLDRTSDIMLFNGSSLSNMWNNNQTGGHIYANTSKNVGIGTDLPEQKLDVRGNILTVGNIIISSTDNLGVAHYLQFPDGTKQTTASPWYNNNLAGVVYLSYTGPVIISGALGVTGNFNTAGNLILSGTSGTNYIQFPDGTKQYSSASGSGVFIKTGDRAEYSTAANPLATVYSSSSQSAISIGVADVQYAYAEGAVNVGDVMLLAGRTGNGAIGSGTKNLIIGNVSAGRSILFATRNAANTSDNTSLEITESGKVKIGAGALNPGSLDADYKLAVYGKIVGTQIIASAPANWSDYVFSKDFELMDLKDVSRFIEKNKYLPGMPSEKEVKLKGVNMAEMDALLLKKIEELTLYVLQQQKEIEALKSKSK